MSKKTTAIKDAIVKKKAQQFTNAIVQQLDALSKTRENWEKTDYKKTSDGLYKLLSECLDVFNAQYVRADKAAQNALRKELTDKLTASGLRVLTSSPTLTMFVRYVFKSDRNRAHSYASVLLAAIEAGIDAKDLPNFIIQEGGIEEIKRRQVKSASAIAKQDKLNAAKAEVRLEVEMASAMTPLATVAIEGLIGSYALMLVKPKLNGTVDVVGALSDLPPSMVDTLITRMAKARVQETLTAV